MPDLVHIKQNRLNRTANVHTQATTLVKPEDKPTVNKAGDIEPVRFGYDFSRINIFPKLEISNPGDSLELEADTMADKVMRMPDNSGNPDSLHPIYISRKCSQCQDNEDDKVYRQSTSEGINEGKMIVSRKLNLYDYADNQTPEELPVQDNESGQNQLVAANHETGVIEKQSSTNTLSYSINNAINSSGQELPSRTRKFMEPRFGYDFRSVQIHTDSTANNLARQLHARAFATGNNIFFSTGEFQPDQHTGKQLLAHELAHVVQQGRGKTNIQRIQRKGNGCLNCRPYCGYDSSIPLPDYNCTGLAHRAYKKIGLSTTQSLLSAGTPVSATSNCSSVGVIKHWLWEYDMHLEDSSGSVVSPTWHDFHTVGGPTDGDPVPADPDEVYTKNGARKVYGPGTGPSFKPPLREPSTLNVPAETPQLDSAGKQMTKVRSNMTESCFCIPCPPAVKKSP